MWGGEWVRWEGSVGGHAAGGGATVDCMRRGQLETCLPGGTRKSDVRQGGQRGRCSIPPSVLEISRSVNGTVPATAGRALATFRWAARIDPDHAISLPSRSSCARQERPWKGVADVG